MCLKNQFWSIHKILEKQKWFVVVKLPTERMIYFCQSSKYSNIQTIINMIMFPLIQQNIFCNWLKSWLFWLTSRHSVPLLLVDGAVHVVNPCIRDCTCLGRPSALSSACDHRQILKKRRKNFEKEIFFWKVINIKEKSDWYWITSLPFLRPVSYNENTPMTMRWRWDGLLKKTLNCI